VSFCVKRPADLHLDLTKRSLARASICPYTRRSAQPREREASLLPRVVDAGCTWKSLTAAAHGRSESGGDSPGPRQFTCEPQTGCTSAAHADTCATYAVSALDRLQVGVLTRNSCAQGAYSGNRRTEMLASSMLPCVGRQRGGCYRSLGDHMRYITYESTQTWVQIACVRRDTHHQVTHHDVIHGSVGCQCLVNLAISELDQIQVSCGTSCRVVERRHRI
jgi:hypothetical protein